MPFQFVFRAFFGVCVCIVRSAAERGRNGGERDEEKDVGWGKKTGRAKGPFRLLYLSFPFDFFL